MRTLYYTPASSSLVSIEENGTTLYWYNVTNVFISASSYSVPDSGSSDFGATVGDIRITAYSGSTLLATFPVYETTLYYPPFPLSSNISSSFVSSSAPPITYNQLSWYFNFNSSSFTPGETLGIISTINNTTTTSSVLYVAGETGSGIIRILTNNSHSLFVSGSGSYDAYIYVNNTTLGSSSVAISSSASTPLSASFIPLSYYNYEVTFSVISVV
jgi:hypothetical protein